MCVLPCARSSVGLRALLCVSQHVSLSLWSCAPSFMSAPLVFALSFLSRAHAHTHAYMLKALSNKRVSVTCRNN